MLSTLDTSVAELPAPPHDRENIRRGLEEWVYGMAPPPPSRLKVVQTATERLPKTEGVHVALRLSLPEHPEQPLTLMLACPPGGRARPTILWLQNRKDYRGLEAWPPVVRAMERGFNVATFSCWDAQPDDPEGLGWGQLYPDYDWGTLRCWAWAASRCVDALVERPEVDADRIAVTGHSRRGKTSLLAMAMDDRISACLPNASGCMGLELCRSRYREDCDRQTLAGVSREFPYWFSPRFAELAENPMEIPWDQHWLLALAAPRPVITRESPEDIYADVPSVKAALKAGAPFYDALGVDPERMLVMQERSGPHGHTQADWDWQVLMLADIWGV